MASYFEPIYVQLIRSAFKNDQSLLEQEYDLRYELRKSFGLNFEKGWEEVLEQEWAEDHGKIVKRRNWLWYLMKSGQYDMLDEQLNTSIYQDKIVYENKRAAQREDARRRKPKSQSWWEYSSTYKYWDLSPEEVKQDDSWLVEYENTPYTYKPKKRVGINRPQGIDNTRCYRKVEEPRPAGFYERICSAALRLRQLIEGLIDYRRSDINSIELTTIRRRVAQHHSRHDRIYDPQLSYQGNIEENVGGDTDVVQISKANNVVLTETEVTQSDNTSVENIGWSRFVSSDTVSDMDTLVNRWFRVGTYNWVTSLGRNSTIASIDLPRAAILGGVNTCNQPNQIPFRIHRYWRGDMTVKIHVNSNKFQIGQLQCSWYYQPKADGSFPTKNNVYTRSGAHHCVISAAPNNEVELVIPFKSYKSMYHTKTYSGDERDLPLDLGTLFITVLSPLKTTGETSPKCSFTVFVKFSNNEFTGMIAGDVDVPGRAHEELQYQMDKIGTLLSTAVPIVEKMLVGSSNDNNRDNPPVVNPPLYFVPTASHSWSVGTDVSEPLQNLRLSGRAQTCHPDRDLDEMKVDVLKRKYMLQDVFSWSQQNNNGQLLWSLPANPIPPKNRIYRTAGASANHLASYQLTTIGFLSSLYQYWRGSIEYRFDIVASQFHSGKLLLAYIPGVAEGAQVTLEQARASPNVVISLDNAMSYTWRIPYIADRPWWPRRYAGESVSNNSESPSKIFVFVLNELVMAETVPDSVEILVYMRGGEDMEFAVPVQPSIGLGFDRNYVSSRDDTVVFPVSTTDTYYGGNWHSAPLVQVWRHATTSEAVGRFSEPITDRPAYYTLTGTAPQMNISPASVLLLPITRCIFLRGIGFSEFIGVPIVYRDLPGDAARLEALSRAAHTNNYTYGAWVSDHLTTVSYQAGFIPSSYVTTSNTYGGGKTSPWTATTVSPEVEFEELNYQGNREESLALVDNTQMLRSTGRGFMTYGERFIDLKDLCRRYQIYGWTTVPRNQIERDPGACSFLFPVLPQGLDLAVNTPTQVNQIWNRAREGHIPLISSLFRFYRGSMRIRIVTSNAKNLVMWVQHRPDRRLDRNVIVPCTQVSTAEAVFNHSYGMYMQDMSVNRVVEIEVPYYQMANYGLLQKPVITEGGPLRDWSHFYSLGELSVGFFGNAPTGDVRCTIYYSIADDCRFTTYQGVPPMVIIDDLPEFQETLRYQGLKDFFGINPKELGQEVVEGATERLVEDVHCRVMPMLSDFVGSFQEKLSDTYASVKESMADASFYSKLSSLASQIIHAINNPSPSTIAISVISILLILGIATYSAYQALHKYVVEIWNWISNKVCSKKVREEVEVAQEANESLHYQNDSQDNAVVGFLSLICGGLCSLFGMKNSIKYKPASDSLFIGLTNGMKMSNVCFVFFKNLMSVIGDMKAAIVAHLYPGFNAAECLMQGRDIIEKWVNYSQELLDPMVAKNLMYDRDLQTRLLDCYAFGKILKVKALETQYPAVIQLINTTFDKLHKQHVELVAQGLDPHIRKMPFVIYNCGAPEIGKSHLTTDLCAELCKSQEITTETDLMCVLNATSKFWDNCDRQPCLVMDDAFNIRKGTMLEDQIAAIFNVVSPVVLVPPKAAVEDKGRMYNPEIFIMNSNCDFFKTELCLEEALWRRRDILIYTYLDSEYAKEGCVHCSEKLKINSSLPPEAISMLKDFHHLKFKYTFDVKNPNCVYQPENRYIKYPELLALLKDLFKKNREAENIKFAHRIEQTNMTAGDRQSIVGNVENLESLWNDAIMKRRCANDIVANSTFKTICAGFSQNVLDAWEEKKHSILKKIYNAVKPGNNKYFNINPTCTECTRIKYQCVSCKIKLEECMKEAEPQPSTSSGNVFLDEDDPKFQGDIAPIPFSHDIKYLLSDQGQRDFSKLQITYPHCTLVDFQQFLDRYQQEITVYLRRYPRYARSFNIFKSVCERFCKCIHNSKINKPIISKGKFAFINPSNPGCPDIISELECNRVDCWMNLPWMYYDTVKTCRKLNKDRLESWMLDLAEKEIKYNNITFNNIFAGMTKFVFDFYYNCMKPAVKTIFNFFSNFGGWVISLGFLSMLFSTIVMGVGCYKIVTDQPDERSLALEKDVVNLNRISMSTVPSGIPSVGYQSNSYESGKPRVTRAAKPKVKTPVRATKDLAYQSSQQFTIVEERLLRNMSSIVAVYQDLEGRLKRTQNYGVMLRDQQMLIQKHYYDFWKRLDITAKFYFFNPNVVKTSEYGIPLNNFFDLDVDWFYSDNGEYIDSNFGILHLPKTVPAFKDITKFIAKSSEHEYIKSDECYLFSSLHNRSMHCVMNLEFNKSVTDSCGWLRLDQCYSYKYTVEGLCGSVLMCSNLERPIIGIHFAGTNTFGYAEPLCSESFIEEKVKHYDYQLHDMLLDGDAPKIEFDTLLYPQGTIHNAYSHHQGSVSQYIPSLIQGVYEVDTEPNPLSPKDPRLPSGNPPLKRGVEHMGKPPLNFEKKLLDAAYDDLKNVILKNVKPIRVCIDKVSLQDAICGNVNVKGFEPIEWSSSEGFPLKSLRPSGVKGKRWLFDLEETPEGYRLKGMHGELTRQLSVCYDLRKRGIRVPTLFTDCLKDTCIDVKKCSIPGKTRVFSVSPIQYTIAFKQYFNDFMASYQNARIDAEHGIGINVDSLEWSAVADYLTRYGNNIVAGDYKNYGPSLMLTCVEKAFDIIMAWYERYDPDPERQLIRRVLLSEILHAKHLCLNVVFGVPCGIPSGSPITTPLNSLVNSLYLRCAWKYITKLSFDVMHANVKILTYGDDVCINVSDKFKELFNTETLNDFFSQYNIIFTDVDKSDNIVKYRTLDNVTFLKRGFKLHPNSKVIFLAPIEEQSIRKCVNWITRKGDPLENTLENCKQACELAFGHGPQYYNSVRERLQHECLKRLGKTFLAPSWYEKSEVCYGI
ncbi:MAG: polyprotein [Sanya iflavirus 1]|nr:MAG: polyprotein [Sanya iflavirus 1]